MRPVVLFGDPAIQRAKETGEPRATLERKADDFDNRGMVSLFASKARKQPQETALALRNYGARTAPLSQTAGESSIQIVQWLYMRRLPIRKERIDPRQSWQNYIEAHFGIMRRLADYYLNKAPMLDEMKKAHRKFIQDYNTQIYFAHRERQDNRHSPQDVLRGVLARTVPAPTLARIFFATEFTRHLDRSGYIRFRRWRFYAEAGLASHDSTVSSSQVGAYLRAACLLYLLTARSYASA